MMRRPPRSTLSSSSAASDVYKRQVSTQSTGSVIASMAVTHNDDALKLLFKKHADKFARMGLAGFLKANEELAAPDRIVSPTRENGSPHTDQWSALQTNGKTAQEKRELKHIVEVLTSENQVLLSKVEEMPALRAEVKALREEREVELLWLHSQLGLPSPDGTAASMRQALVDGHESLRARLVQENNDLRSRLEQKIRNLVTEVAALQELQAQEREWLGGQVRRHPSKSMDTAHLRDAMVKETEEDLERLGEEKEALRRALSAEIELLRRELASKLAKMEDQLQEKQFELELALHRAEMPKGYENRYLGS
eukprot:TRINITY_DN5215_c0_g1_i1.p1 TRINITY_DN5215_c0_g1~~TRINITY_DN5215_c0_g1_i1.p1  ORF type:complete len:310 (-),score=98.94 TRINITY_DN5215_c0_g1_i1:285-1214(-)